MTTTAEIFWARVDKRAVDGCWEWVGRRDEKGYGRVGFHSRPSVGAHRVAWELSAGPISDGLFVLHRCDNPPCCNPSHLFLGTQADNNRDRHAKGRSRNLDPGELHPKAKLTNEQVRQIRAEYERGLVTQQALAERWGVSRGNVSKILNRKVYVNA
ncbi:MAG: HNH endonuclease [Acidimicrobiales bacterium]